MFIGEYKNNSSHIDVNILRKKLTAKNLFSVGNVQRSPWYTTWGGSPWSTMDHYLTHGRVTGISFWYGTHVEARFIHG